MSKLALRLIVENKRTKSPFLDLGNCGLINDLPSQLFDCVWLERLNLGIRYTIDQFSWFEGSRNNQETNSFKGEELYQLERLPFLQQIDLAWCGISDINFLEKLKSLKVLDISDNEISDYSFLESIIDLVSLNLYNNQLTNISFLKNLRQLKHLSLTNNQIVDISIIENLSQLQTLDLSSNKISDIRSLEKLTNLQNLKLSTNRITDYSYLEKLTTLQSLDLLNNQISDIRFLEKLTGLQSLHLGTNQIADIHFLEKLTGLQSLYLSSNQIFDIRFLEKLSGLQHLNLSYNQISDIRFLGKLTNLQSLQLNSNQISDIRFLEKLTALQYLDLSNNQISDIYSLINLLKKGFRITTEKNHPPLNKTINLYNNPTIKPRLEIIQQGSDAILSWFKNQEVSNLEPFREAKVILLGEPDAGKSSLLKYLIGKEFEEAKSVTRGVNIEKLVFQHNGNDYQINFWDFGGQEVQQSVHQYFLTENTLYIVVLNAVTDEQPDKYLQFLDNNAPNSPFIIVTNKDDLQGTSKLKNNQLNNDYEGRLIASNLRISLRQAAKKEWCDNDENIFEQRNIQLKILFDLVKSSFLKLPHIEEGFLANYKEVKKVVEYIYEHEKKPYITMQEFQKACKEKGIVAGTEKGLLSQLNFIGTVRYLDEDNLRGLHILNPEWLSDGIYRIITDGDVKNKKFGKIQKSDIQQILIPKSEIDYTYQDHEIDFLVEMMCQFKVAYFERDNKSIYIPDSFPEDLPTGFDKKAFITASKHYFFNYDTEIPSYIISRFIVKSFQNVKGNEYWNKGIVLKENENSLNPCEALVEQNDRRIDIWVKGKDIQSFFIKIRENLRNAHEKAFKKYTEMIDLGEENVLYETIWSYKIDGDQEYKSSVVIDSNTGRLKRYNINEILGRFETREIMEKKGDTYIFNGNVDNSGQLGGKNNTQINNSKVEVSDYKEFNTIKEILYDLVEANYKNDDWKTALVNTLDEFNRLEMAEDKPAQKTSLGFIERNFKRLKDLKDIVAIGFLPVDIDKKLPELYELFENLKSHF